VVSTVWVMLSFCIKKNFTFGGGDIRLRAAARVGILRYFDVYGLVCTVGVRHVRMTSRSSGSTHASAGGKTLRLACAIRHKSRLAWRSSKTMRPNFRPAVTGSSIPFTHATSPYANLLSALGGLGHSRVFAGFSPETLMVQGRNGRAFSLRNGGFSPNLEGWPIFPTRFNTLI
jgi:hypothetical protein